MKYFVIFLVLIAAGIVATNPVSAQCAYDPTQPHKPCYDIFEIHIGDTSTPFEIKIHQTIKVDGIEIEFSGIEDSRCPSDVQCVWEGQAILTFSTFYQTQHESHFLNTAKVATVNVGPYKITLIDITPYPTTTKDISEDYVATISISEDSGIHLPPLKQIKSGVPLIDVKCNEGLVLIIKHNDSPACVRPETAENLENRGWGGMPPPCCKPTDVTLEMENATSSYMNKVIPTLEDFRNTLSVSQDIDTIFFKFGEPHNDIGSGIHIYVYDLNDSTQVWIGYTDRILYVYHVDSDGNVLEQLF
jgi:hypothetical protein